MDIWHHISQLLHLALTLGPGESGLPNSTPNLGVALTNIIKLLFSIIGGLSIIFILVGGVQLVTSAGSPARVKQGRETVIYAVVGLVVAASAFAVVSFIGGKL
jgi:hypothetical protein